MKIVSPKLISFLAGAALFGLCIIQYYWISNAVNEKREHFMQDVREALVQVSRRYNRQMAAERLQQQLSYHRQSFMPGSNVNGMNGDIHVFEEFTNDSAGIIHHSSRQSIYPWSSENTSLTTNVSNGVTSNSNTTETP